MGGNNLVFDTKMIKGHHIVNCFAFESVEILHRKHIVLIPLQLETGPVGDNSFDMTFVEKIIYLLLINLEI